MRKHLDSNVVYFMLLIFVLGFSVSAFRYHQHIPCEGLKIQLQNKPYYVGEFISFKDATKGAENWRWNFGDSSPIKTGREVLHKFKTVGIHTVSLQINGVCDAEREITIRRDKKIISPKKIFFIAPDKIAVGETFEVKDTTSTSRTWEWRFGDGLSEVATHRNVTHSYEEPGTKTIRLIVNGSDYVSYQSVEVYEKEAEEEPVNRIKEPEKGLGWDIKDEPIDEEKDNNQPGATKKAPLISEQEFKTQLELLGAGKVSSQSFGKYFCGDLNKPITTDRKGVNTFLKLCMDIKGRKIAIRSLELIRNEGVNCINNLTIEYKRKGKFKEKATEKIKVEAAKLPLKPKP